jgi:hypothetical protein
VGYPGYSYIDTGSLVRGIFLGLSLGFCCCCLCYGLRAAWTKAGSALHRRHAETSLRAEVARGLAELELFLRARSASAANGEPPDADGDKASPT